MPDTLEASPLGLDAAAVERALAPFLIRRMPVADPEWRRRLRELRRQTLRQSARSAVRKLLTRRRRDQAAVKAEYDKGWPGQPVHLRYDAKAVAGRGSPWVWRDHGYLISGKGGARVRLLYLMRTLAWLKPASVLEVGFGNGINLMLLSARFPDIRFAGVELSRGGFEEARRIQQAGSLPEVIRAFAPEPLADLAAFGRVELRQGTAAALPFADGCFDLVYTSLALEQMEAIRPTALAELARVARRHVVMLEPFREFNRALVPALYVWSREYFRGAVAELAGYGLTPALCLPDMPAEVWLRPALVVCEKRTGATADPGRLPGAGIDSPARAAAPR